MQIQLESKDGSFHFEALNESGVEIHLDASEAIGGTGKGARPMQMVLYGLAGCSGIDMLNILKKQKQIIESLSIEVNAKRDEGAIAAVLTEIDVHFMFKGTIEESKIQKALELTFGKYCSVAKMLEKTAKITYSYTLNSTP